MDHQKKADGVMLTSQPCKNWEEYPHHRVGEEKIGVKDCKLRFKYGAEQGY